MAEKMKAQVFYEPEKMSLEEVDVPKPKDDQVLVNVKACGICGSDVAYYFGASSLETEDGKGPCILGHEFSAEVVEVGAIPKGLGLFKPGDRVTLDPVQYCNACRVCKQGYVNLCEKKAVLGVSTDGGFAEYAVSHFTGVHKIADNVSFEEAAMTEPLGCATYGVSNMNVQPGDFAVVFGAGTIGCMMMQLIKASGAGRVVAVDIEDYRLKIAEKNGADVCVNTKDKKSPYYKDDLKTFIGDLTNGNFADAVITPTGAVEAMEAALEVSGRRARIVYFGLPADDAVVRVPALQSILWDKTIRFSWLAPLVWPRALDAIATGLIDLKPLATHTFALDKLIDGLTLVRDKKDDVMKALVKP
jgi:L-iditol 2-dehydrogenase